MLSVALAASTEKTKKRVKDYLKEKGFYSYDAASIDEDPVSRWIGREVKRFLAARHISTSHFFFNYAQRRRRCARRRKPHKTVSVRMPIASACDVTLRVLACLLPRRAWHAGDGIRRRVRAH